MSGINFRATSGFVTDGAGETYSLGETFPTVRGGQTFGWGTNRAGNSRDRNAANVRTAGCVFVPNSGATDDFIVTLPSAGDYSIRLALGDFDYAQNIKCVIKDGTTALATIIGSPADAAWFDATGVDRHPYTTWESNNAAATFTFSTTTLRLTLGGHSSGSAGSAIAHLSYTLVGGSSTNLAPADGAHAHGADNLTLSASGATNLVIADGAHAHAADNVVLAVGNALVLPALKNNAGTVLASETGATAFVYDVSTGALVVKKTGQTTNGSGVMTVVDASIVSGTTYRVVIVLASGAEGMDKVAA